MTTEQEALEIADAITCFEGCNCDKNQAAAMLRKLVAEREEYRAAMREALTALIEIRRLESLGLDWAPVSADAITDLRQRLEGTT